jgi:hypothetical protein
MSIFAISDKLSLESALDVLLLCLQSSVYMSRNQVHFFANVTLDVSEVLVSDMSVREIVSKISLSGGQGFVL